MAEHHGYAREVGTLGRGRWFVGLCVECPYRSGRCAHPGQAESRAREHAAAMNTRRPTPTEEAPRG